MRLAFLLLLSLCSSACFAKRFLQIENDEDIPIMGGFQDIDLSNPTTDYLNTLTYLQTSLNTICHFNSDVETTSVEKASVQIVAGANYEIVFKVKNHENEQLTVNVFQSLPENGVTSYKVDSCNIRFIQVVVEEPVQGGDIDESTQGGDVDDSIQGGFQQIDLQNPTSDYLDTLAYLQTSLNVACHFNTDLEVTSVEKASFQIVAGTNYEIVFKVKNHENEQLTVNVYQSLPENGVTSYQVDSCIIRFIQVAVDETNQSEDDSIQGGFQQIDLQNPSSDYLDALAYLQTHLNTLCQVNGDVEVTGVEKASVQIVAGANYEIVFKVQNHENEQLTVKVYQSLPENGEFSYEIDSCI